MTTSLKDKIISKARRNVLLACLLFFVLLGAVVVFLNRSAVSAASSQVEDPGTIGTSSGVGTINWTNPANATTANAVYATASITYNATSYYLLATNFGFNIPTGSTINGISARVKRYSGSATYIKDAYVRLIKGGVVQTTNKAVATGWPTSNTYSATYGGAADLWSGTWTPADVNASNFGIAIAAKNTKTTSGTYIAYVDHIELTVFYTLPVPNVPTLVSPSNAANGVGLLPTLQFIYSDPNNVSSTMFNIQIDDNSDFSSPVASTTVSGSWASGSTISYTVASPLSGGTKYYWRSMVYNGYSWSAWSGGTGLNLGNINNIATGNDGNNFAVSNSGNLYGWGSNTWGELGIGNTTNQLTPVQVKGVGGSGYLTGVSQVSAGDIYACALKTDGTVYCWGDNSSGQLGINNTTDQTYPVQVLGVGGSGYLTGVIQIEAGDGAVCALKSDNTVFCWGDNSYNQLGIGNTTNQLTPVQVKGVGGSGYLTGVSQLSLAFIHSCALKTDGTVYCWGDNSTGQLGINSTTSQAYPVQVKGVGGSGYLSNVNYVATGGAVGNLTGSTCAVKIDGTAWCWGYNDPMLQLGIGSAIYQLTPAQVLGAGGSGYFTDASQMAPQVYHSCAVKTDGTVYCVGENDDGELGINNTTDKIYLTQTTGVGGFGFLTGAIQILPSEGPNASKDYSCALKSDGTVFCWGGNDAGQLGINNTTQKNAPVQVLKGAAISPDVDGLWNFTTLSSQPPDIPTLVSPANGATGVSLSPALQFGYSDPGSNNCTQYDLQIDDNSDFSSPVTSTSVTGSWASGSTINHTVVSPLSAGIKYYWKVRAYDGTSWSAWSDGTWNFTIVNGSSANYTLSGWAWSENVEWISFSSENTGSPIVYGVNIDSSTGLLSGQAWSGNIGWISFDPADLTGCPSGACEARMSNTTYAFSGWARALAASSSASGWDGWIKLNGTTSAATPYGVFLNNSTKELYGWAWGGNTANADSAGVIGWISFNCSNMGSCGSIDYKVQSVVQPPTISNLTAPSNTSDNYCKSYIDTSVPPQKLSGRNGSVGFSWLYQDPGPSPLASYQLKVSEDSNIAGVTTTYQNWSGLIDPGQVDSSLVNVTSTFVSNEMLYNKTYYWWVNACNAGGACTDWIAGPSFSTPLKHYPIVGIAWVGKKLTANENIQFCTTANVNDPADPCYSACYKGSASPAVPDDPNNAGTQWVCSACFANSANQYKACQDVSGTLYNWIFPGTEGTDFSFASSTTATSSNPVVKFLKSGKDRSIKLQVSGSSCGGERISDILLPNPVWKEKSPF